MNHSSNMNVFSMLLSHLGIDYSMTNMEKASFDIALRDKRQIAERTYEFVFEKPKNFLFNAGQHIRMTLINPAKTDSKGNSRFLTLANTPQDKDLIVAMRMSDSAFKKVLGNLRIGEKVNIQILLHSPHQSFVIHDDPSVPVVFLIGGIGIVPAYSMIKDAIQRKLPHKIFLFYSNRRPEDAPYLNELKNLAQKHKNFVLVATMTQMEKSKQPWRGENGFIDQAMLSRYVADVTFPIYYIAGLTGMVTAMKKLLAEIGVKEEHIRSEDFSEMKMSIMNMSANSSGYKNYILFVAIGLILILVILAHVGAATSLLNAVSLEKLSYFSIGFIILIIIFKIIILIKLKYFFSSERKKFS